MKGEKNPFKELIDSYESYLQSSFRELWDKVKIEPDKLDAYAVIGALLSRQVTLSIQMVRSPKILNGHSAPLFLRSMTDLHITLSWILKDLEERAKQYILHGLGEEKLLIEHHKQDLEDNPNGPNDDLIREMIEIKDQWINSQRRDFFVEVNLGHWAQLDTRKMSIEGDCESLYKYAYKPFSVAAHSMWPHVSIYNSRMCENPLHKYHLVPDLLEAPIDIDYLYRSCKYVHKTYKLFVDTFNIKLDQPLPLEWWDDYFREPEQKPIIKR